MKSPEIAKSKSLVDVFPFQKKYSPHIRKNGSIIARKPIRENRTCQKETASKKLDIAAISQLKSFRTKKYNPNTVRVPKSAETTRSAQGVLPNILIDWAWMFMNNPSRPLLSG